MPRLFVLHIPRSYSIENASCPQLVQQLLISLSNMGPGNNAMRSFLDYVLVLIVRFGAGSALVMVKNVWL